MDCENHVYNTNNNKVKKLKPICQQDGLRKSCIKITLDQYSGLIDALK